LGLPRCFLLFPYTTLFRSGTKSLHLKEPQRGVVHGSAAGPTYPWAVGAATHLCRTATIAWNPSGRGCCGHIFCCTSPIASQRLERYVVDTHPTPGNHWWRGAAIRGNGSHRSPTPASRLAVCRWAHGRLSHVDDPRRGPISRNRNRVRRLRAHRIATAVILWFHPLPGSTAYSAGTDDWPVGVHGPGHADRR